MYNVMLDNDSVLVHCDCFPYFRTNVPLTHFQAETNGSCTLFLLSKQLGFCVCVLNLKKEEKSEASVVFVQQKQLVSDWGGCSCFDC